MPDHEILLVDNGSTRPDATLNLRRLAAALSERLGLEVQPVSLQHADRIPAEKLDGMPAAILKPYLDERLAAGTRRFIVLPLFFGISRALTRFVPGVVGELQQTHGQFDLQVADVLIPLPKGEPRMAQLLWHNIRAAADRHHVQPKHVIVVDHGSPLPEVTAARQTTADQLRRLCPGGCRVDEAVMERRDGAEYDFNGLLLADQLDHCATQQPATSILIALLFVSPGRHAGSDGDIESICDNAMRRHPDLWVFTTELVGDHPLLLDILADRLHALVPA